MPDPSIKWFKGLSILSFLISIIALILAAQSSNQQTQSQSENAANHVIPSYDPTISPVSIPSVNPTESPTKTETIAPTSNPTPNPTQDPSVMPSNAPQPSPTSQPTPSPTDTPTISPTTQFPTQPTMPTLPTHTAFPTSSPVYVYENYVGDYKVSAQTRSHGNWLLCDGSFISPSQYSQLFGVGYSFGSKDLSQFALPNGNDRVIGINGDKYNMGNEIGKDNMTLNVGHIPSHSHPISITKYRHYGTGSGNYGYQVTSWGNPIAWDSYNTGSNGSGYSFSLYQPTIFLGNLFIYAGDGDCERHIFMLYKIYLLKK